MMTSQVADKQEIAALQVQSTIAKQAAQIVSIDNVGYYCINVIAV